MQKRSQEKAKKRHDNVMRLLVRRYITAEQRKRDDFGITEDDVMEIRQDISSLRFELIDILSTNGMKTPNINLNAGQCKLFIFKHSPRRICYIIFLFSLHLFIKLLAKRVKCWNVAY